MRTTKFYFNFYFRFHQPNLQVYAKEFVSVALTIHHQPTMENSKIKSLYLDYNRKNFLKNFLNKQQNYYKV